MKTIKQDGMIIEFDCEAIMPDKTVIRYDIYRPDKEGQFPCITTYGPYSKGMAFLARLQFVLAGDKRQVSRDFGGHQWRIHELGNG